ncbi:MULTISPECIES: hypothetical protein [unclassified Acidovorax]|uniref:hypothetical protein n=1 Tax=unclassified Acidovorax TaxID=2684926 RepID=UPI00234BEB07|nr:MULTISPECIES: hypothetical protein [unclassified Acidovorax]WCM90600.1 hypothetical protein M5C98_11525 [Acidovorax sp. NCPPB 3576]GKS91585.1 hypothetical protein AVTE2539_19490 [Acidovorax sp. SUPP2539]
MPATFVHSDGTEFIAEGLALGIPIDPRLPEDFDSTPNSTRPPSHGKWWYLPFIRTETIEAMDAFYAQRTDEHAPAAREFWREGRATWLAAWPSGTRYDVRCLDGGAWDRSTNWGSFPTLEQAVECALTQGANMNRIVCATPDPVAAGGTL